MGPLRFFFNWNPKMGNIYTLHLKAKEEKNALFKWSRGVWIGRPIYAERGEERVSTPGLRTLHTRRLAVHTRLGKRELEVTQQKLRELFSRQGLRVTFENPQNTVALNFLEVTLDLCKKKKLHFVADFLDFWRPSWIDNG